MVDFFLRRARKTIALGALNVRKCKVERFKCMKLKILMVSSECAPFSKVGGLADMVSSLSKQFAADGYDVKVFTPLYSSVKRTPKFVKKFDNFSIHMGLGIEEFASVWSAPLGKAEALFLEFNRYYQRDGIYNSGGESYGDNGGRFAFLSRAALDFCLSTGWIPDVIHCHDWPTGLVPVYLNTTLRNSILGRSATVFTIHNLQHQGIFNAGVLEYAGIPMREFRADSCEALGNLNMMKGALFNATKLTTVSPTYAREIQTSEYGCGLEGVLKFRAADLIGIINGVDVQEWNPASDPMIASNYSLADMSGKSACKRALQERVGLKVSSKIPLFGVVSRLFDQKGLDLLARIAQPLVDNMNIQLMVLGGGEPWLEDSFKGLTAANPGKIASYIGYSNELSHMIEAGSDFFIMPSRFEPCGLNQMYSMIYATLPIVRRTGGLADTVSQYEEGAGIGTGFLFDDATTSALYNTIGWACSTWYDRKPDITALRRNAMGRDFSWSASAEKYAQVYKWSVDARTA